jgi:cytochrome P450/NADPH-cytochrome P450 reductase
MPANPQTPLIMVGPGTGLAPFRGFLQERAALRAQGRELGPAILFFGCRNPAVDFIYRDELEAWQQQGITDRAVAFSRVPGRPREYVQDKIKERADDVWRLLAADGAIYICGDASKMAPDVRRAFATIYMSKTGADEPAAEAWLNDLAAAGSYIADVWAG